MPVQIRELKDVTNATILDAIRNDEMTSSGYYARVPSATDAGVEKTVRTLRNYAPLWNEFIDSLINRIGQTIVRSMVWDNPLRMFKQGLLEYGSTIQELQVGLLKSHVYDPDREYMERDLFGTERPWVEANYHSVNRQEFYKLTVNEDLLNRAFVSDTGLSQFVSALMSAPATSDNWDEFNLTTSLLAKYEDAGGFYHVHVPDVAAHGSTETDAKEGLRKLRAMAQTLQFPSTKYNAAGMPTFANPDDLIILASPEWQAATDVEALAAAFNIDRANVMGKIVTIPKESFGIAGMQAIMTVPDFFVIADKILTTTSQVNPVSLGTNYFLHHHEVISCSRFVPAVAFWTGADDEVITVTKPPTGITGVYGEGTTTAPGSVDRGGLLALEAPVEPADAPQGVLWSVTGNQSNRTYVTAYGVLHPGEDETAGTVTVTATTAYPGNRFSKSATITLTGEIEKWPEDKG